MPLPRHLDDSPQVRVLRGPAQLRRILSLLATSTAGSPGRRAPISAGIGWPVTSPGRLDHLVDREALAIAQVVDPAALVQRAQGQDVGLGQVDHVDIVAHAGAVRVG